MAIYLISKISKRSNGSDVRWKAVPQMCPTVAETAFQKIGTRLRQNQFIITIPKSIGLSGTPETDHLKVININFNFFFFLLVQRLFHPS